MTENTEIREIRKLKKYILKDWDVCFTMKNSKLLSEILDFLTKINTDVPFKFYQKKIFIHMVSPNVYTEVEIGADIGADLFSKYQPGINENGHDQYKLVFIDLLGIVSEIKKFADEDEPIIVKIDSLNTMRAEFIIGNRARWARWANILNPKSLNEQNLIELNKTLSETRNDQNIPSANLTMRPESFSKICKLKTKNRAIDVNLFFLVEQDGLFITCGDESGGRSLKILPADVSTVTMKEYSEIKKQEERKIKLLEKCVVIEEGEKSKYKARKRGRNSPNIKNRSCTDNSLMHRTFYNPVEFF
jgi:hypothetical protein